MCRVKNNWYGWVSFLLSLNNFGAQDWVFHISPCRNMEVGFGSIRQHLLQNNEKHNQRKNDDQAPDHAIYAS
jgi:hypothetical protein